jgi:hypothetical protein
MFEGADWFGDVIMLFDSVRNLIIEANKHESLKENCYQLHSALLSLMLQYVANHVFYSPSTEYQHDVYRSIVVLAYLLPVRRV